jgi:flagellar biosynthesis/type III secretory pathway M-ring protein FliF/YscJ
MPEPPRIYTPEELEEKVAAIVRTAAGIDPARNDEVTVEFVRFPRAPAPPPPTVVDTIAEYTPQFGPLAGILAAFVLFQILSRGKRKKGKGGSVATESHRLKLTTGPESLIGQALVRERELPADQAKLLASDLAARDPDQAARVVRAWLEQDTQR